MIISKAALLAALIVDLDRTHAFVNSGVRHKSVLQQTKGAQAVSKVFSTYTATSSTAIFGSNKSKEDSFDAIDDPIEVTGREQLQQYFDFPIDACE